MLQLLFPHSLAPPLRAASMVHAFRRRVRRALKSWRCDLDPERPYDVVKADLHRHAVRLFWRDETGDDYATIDRVRRHLRSRGERIVAATNAGIYEPGYVPTGLFVADGVAQRPLNLNDGRGNFFLKPNGVFAITDDGARILESTELETLASPVRHATQSGPLLVYGGRLHPALHPDSASCHVRCGVGVKDARTVYLAITNGRANLYEFACFFRDTLGTPDALYLDGAISKLYAPHLGRHDDDRFAGILAVVDKR